MRVVMRKQWLLPAAMVLAMAGCDWMLATPSADEVPVSRTSEVAAIEPSRAATVPAPAPATAPPAVASDGADKALPATTATKPFEFDREVVPESSTARCRFDALPPAQDYQLFAAGGYSGRKLGFHIDRSGNAASRIDVAVNQPGKQVALMLGAYDPTVWHIGWSPDTRIIAVLLGGYHRQVITGLPPEVPVIVSTYDDKGPCGYFYVSAEKAATLNPIAQRAFGRKIDMVYPARKGRVVVGDALGSVALVTDRAAKPVASFRIADARAGGQAGLDHAVRRGWLREATRADADAWLAAVARQPSADMPPIAGGRPPGRIRMHNGYVVLKAFELPTGLYGAHSATFFVPKGVPRPTGDLGHSALYDFNTMTCAGAICSMR